MIDKMQLSSYVVSRKKRFVDLFIATTLLLLFLPFIIIISLLVFVCMGWPIIYTQHRVGRMGKIFRIYKFRTMRVGAEQEQNKYMKLNEADGPVFKIRNDPRFVGVGAWLSHVGLDELPQLVNVLCGDMSMVGPRPLPIDEQKRIPEIYKWRTKIRPGIISYWVVLGPHGMTFKQWMKLDMRYQQNGSFVTDIILLYQVFFVVIRCLLNG